jgi:hypothetical protein
MPVVFALGAAGLFAVIALFLRQKTSSLSTAGGMPMGNAGDLTGAGSSGAGSPQKSGLGNQWDVLIQQVAAAERVEPALLKAIVAKESYFDEEALNPERDFVLNGVSYGQYDSAGTKALHDFIAAGNDPKSIGLNPSLGLAQVRVSEGQSFIPGLQAVELFDPQTCLTASARLLRQLFDAGITLDTIDAYNEGQALHRRKLPYRDAVNAYYVRFKGDF